MSIDDFDVVERENENYSSLINKKIELTKRLSTDQQRIQESPQDSKGTKNNLSPDESVISSHNLRTRQILKGINNPVSRSSPLTIKTGFCAMDPMITQLDEKDELDFMIDVMLGENGGRWRVKGEGIMTEDMIQRFYE